MFALVCATVVAVVQAEEPTAQLVNLSTPLLLQKTTEANGMWDSFTQSVNRHVDDEFRNQFDPLNVLDWKVRLGDGNPGPLNQRSARAAGQAFSKSFLTGLREATTDLPALLWAEEQQQIFAGFLESSFGNVDEEAVSPLSPNYQRAERSWWQSLSQDNRMRYGIRPFRPDPYAYLSWAVKDGNRVLLMSNLRYHYVHFGDHSFELAVSAPLSHGLSLDAGTSYQFGLHNEEKRATVKLCKEFRGGSMIHIGFEVRSRPVLVAGLTMPL